MSIEDKFAELQKTMMNTYQAIAGKEAKGSSDDGSVTIILSGTYEFKDCDITKEALVGGITQFKERISQALKESVKKVQEITQNSTASLLSNISAIGDFSTKDEEDDTN